MKYYIIENNCDDGLPIVEIDYDGLVINWKSCIGEIQSVCYSFEEAYQRLNLALNKGNLSDEYQYDILSKDELLIKDIIE